MPELFEPADPRSGDREIGGSGRLTVGSGRPTVASKPPAGSPLGEGKEVSGIVTAPSASSLRPPASSLQPPASGLQPPASSLPPALLFDCVSKWYGPVIGVNQVTLELREGITGLVGHNGSGKSTLLRLASGQLRPDLGQVQVCGHDAWNPHGKRFLGFCPEHDAFYEEMSGRRFVETMARLWGLNRNEARRRTTQVLEMVGMSERAHRPLGGYSKGMRQRIKLAQALLHDPPLLLLDEPLAGIDPLGRRDLVALFVQLAQAGKCLLISSHELEELDKLTDHVAIMARGRIAAMGTLTQIRDLLDNHPLTVRLACDQNARLATLLWEMEEIVGIERENGCLRLRVRSPRCFFHRLGTLVLEENLDIRHLEAVDDSAQAVLGYLLGGRRSGD